MTTTETPNTPNTPARPRPLKLLTVQEVAAALRVDPVTVRRWIKAGRITATKIGGAYRISATDLERALAHGVHRTSSPLALDGRAQL